MEEMTQRQGRGQEIQPIPITEQTQVTARLKDHHLGPVLCNNIYRHLLRKMPLQKMIMLEQQLPKYQKVQTVHQNQSIPRNPIFHLAIYGTQQKKRVFYGHPDHKISVFFMCSQYPTRVFTALRASGP